MALEPGTRLGAYEISAQIGVRERDWLMVVPIQLQPFSVGTPRRLLQLPATT